ncbi:GIY-YIG nuclease family protein [Kaistella flava (ex Peng et al. 2021)]|uniref:GIY-YIG nuclease family protein n=1 Tax=Kaistella flava (ex Peng et al. 2021) TaxID=2038776 RepID=A0A7M2Y9W5_9FLAO|nr:GIY-YIG nuclease family protein [Kaistella flava (ex Peng et al. 2021)]QOW10374.1 GIY-YIG nuclease family protein [Kaistella flava (ex Peng et al. 2021)]
MAFAKTIKIFLIDGDPNGRMSCELSNWTGKAYKIPRIKIKDCSDRSDLNTTGVYLLFGKNEEGKDLVYIGEAENVLVRLNQHLSSKDFWKETIVFISKDENLNKAHIKYLENRLHDIATRTNRYAIENGCTPTLSSISESDRAEMEEFIENIKLMVNTLGHKVFEDKRELSTSRKDKELLYIKSSRGCDAIAEQTSEGFLVLKGSKIADSVTPSISNSIKEYRLELINKNLIIDYEFKEDYIFSSPSYAATIVMGRSANGLTEWKTIDGRILKSLESNQ